MLFDSRTSSSRTTSAVSVSDYSILFRVIVAAALIILFILVVWGWIWGGIKISNLDSEVSNLEQSSSDLPVDDGDCICADGLFSVPDLDVSGIFDLGSPSKKRETTNILETFLAEATCTRTKPSDTTQENIYGSLYVAPGHEVVFDSPTVTALLDVRGQLLVKNGTCGVDLVNRFNILNQEFWALANNPHPGPTGPTGPAAPVFLPAVSRTIWVGLNGSDTEGDGTPSNPFLTVAAAFAIIPDSHENEPWLVQLYPGFYAEDIDVPADVVISGESPASVFIQGYVKFNHSSWCNTGFHLGGARTLNIFGEFAVDFRGCDDTANQVITTQALSVQGPSSYFSDNPDNSQIYFALSTFADVTIQGGSTTILGLFATSVTIISQEVCATSVNVAGGTTATNWNITFTDGDASITTFISNHYITGTLTVSGVNATVSATAASLPLAEPTILNGATFTLLTPATATRYDPDNTDNWETIPTTVQEGLDYLASTTSQYAFVYENVGGATVAVEAPIVFCCTGEISDGITHSATSSNITVTAGGVFEVQFFVASTSNTTQWAVAVNGVAVAASVYGTTTSFTVRGTAVVSASAGSSITIINHTSSGGTKTLDASVGGSATALSASVFIKQLA
jgi:hypothetical protein